jgi:hypothetical protein
MKRTGRRFHISRQKPRPEERRWSTAMAVVATRPPRGRGSHPPAPAPPTSAARPQTSRTEVVPLDIVETVQKAPCERFKDPSAGPEFQRSDGHQHSQLARPERSSGRQIGSSASFQSVRSTASRVAPPARTLPRTAVHARAGSDNPPFNRAASITAASDSTTTKYRPCTPSI